MTTGFLHPGGMGASLAAACRDATVWCGAGRSAATRHRATAAGMTEAASLDELAEQADVIVSVCPPAAAVEVAEAVAATGFAGVYVDANAIAPATARRIGRSFDRFVDGGVIGPPATAPGTTRLYLSGPDAPAVAARWDGSVLEVRQVDGGPGAASAVKVCYAAWTKGTAALLLAIRALACAEEVEDTLLAEWATSNAELIERSDRAASGNASRAWRFVGEMEEIAASMRAHDLPDGFGLAAAEVYARLARLDDPAAATLAAAVGELLAPGPSPPAG